MVEIKKTDDKYTMEDFKEIIGALRSENGCPWDKEQTHDSLKPCLMEETAEVLSAIRILNQTKNPANLREELGDVLLQVVMHSQIAKEEQFFTFDDVVDEISRKMIRRHPHVFGTVQAENAEQVLNNWDEIKKKEKETQDWVKNPLTEIPYELPALTRASKVIKKIDKLYEPQPKSVEAAEELIEQAEKAGKILKLQQEQKEAGNDISKEEKETLESCVTEMLWQIAQISAKHRIPIEQLLADKIEDAIEAYEKGTKW